jgi:hypothetical protein
LDVYFSDYRGYTKKALSQFRTEGGALIWCHYEPSYSADRYNVFGLPDGVPIVHMTIYAMPREIMAEFQIRRQAVREALNKQISLVTPKGITPDLWQFWIELVPETEPVLLCRYKTWNGLREGMERSMKIVLNPPEESD